MRKSLAIMVAFLSMLFIAAMTHAADMPQAGDSGYGADYGYDYGDQGGMISGDDYGNNYGDPGGMGGCQMCEHMGGEMKGGMMGRCTCGCGKMGCECGKMGGRMEMEHPMMHGMIEEGEMMGGLPGMGMTPVYRMALRRAIIRSMIRSALQDPEIKNFLDQTSDLRKDLVMKRFEFFEAFRNPATTPDELKKLKDQIRDLEKKIREKMMPCAHKEKKMRHH